ncbi:hypothetical protein MLD38_009892 [Melastoma candidum]|uniref:Uncharacterized protein n=1 Tax=Melastoma candidum TaxID=119954 RepID=A0ACB9S212_9MYRT|nr:hypothetical protein MLD38_009892 [Melastoma candidum]
MDGPVGNGILGHGFLFSSHAGVYSSDRSASRVSFDGGDNGVFLHHDNGVRNSDSARLFATPSSPPRISSSGNYIEHPVSKFDTLAGVAIRYGVEVADIKRLNGLVTDIQMFALKTLNIPLPGRHPPSANAPNGSVALSGNGEHVPPKQAHDDLLDSFLSLKLKSSHYKVSSSMSSLQGYYGLKSENRTKSYGGFEMAVFSKGDSQDLGDGPFLKSSPASGTPLGLHRKSRSVANGLFQENGATFDHKNEGNDVDSDRRAEKFIRRRQKSEMDFLAATPELLLKEEFSSGAGGFSASAGKNLALRSKGSRASLVNDSELGPATGGVDSIIPDSATAVKKSSSTSSLQEQESSNSSRLSIWSLKPDLQALSTSAIGRPIFDGLPKPGKKNKAALD